MPPDGELTHGTLQMIINHSYVDIQSNESFLDVGSGRGATALQVALSRKNITLAAGVELSSSRHAQACSALLRLTQLSEKVLLSSSSISLVKEDMFAMDWSMFDVVYVSALCFRRSMMLEIQKKLIQEVKPGSRIFSLRAFPPRTTPLHGR